MSETVEIALKKINRPPPVIAINPAIIRALMPHLSAAGLAVAEAALVRRLVSRSITLADSRMSERENGLS